MKTLYITTVDGITHKYNEIRYQWDIRDTSGIIKIVSIDSYAADFIVYPYYNIINYSIEDMKE